MSSLQVKCPEKVLEFNAVVLIWKGQIATHLQRELYFVHRTIAYFSNS